MNINTIICSIVCAGFGWLTACSNEGGVEPEGMPGDAVSFTATLQTMGQAATKGAFDKETGETGVLPYVNGISVQKVQPSRNTPITASYRVMSANKGVLEYAGPADNPSPLKWDKEHLDEPVDFFAWTTPSGVQINTDADEGTVDFVTGNRYVASSADDKDKLDGVAVTPLEVFISASSQGNDYRVSPSVVLPFTHQVSKVSLYLRNWDYQHIASTDASNVSIEFFSIPRHWKVAKNETTSFRVTEPDGSSTDNLKLNFTDLYYDDANGYFTFYLPPLTGELSTDFVTAGDFCITYGGDGSGSPDKFYGTLASISVADLKFTELPAGRHLAIQLDLSENYGVGIGSTIVDWRGPDKEGVLYANPDRGIYSVEGLRCLAEYLNNTDQGKQLADSLHVTDGGKTVIRLYNDLVVTAANASILGASLEGIVFDGQRHTITLPGGTSGLFNRIGASSVGITTEIKNLYLKGGAVKAQGMLANTAGNVTVTNCHVLAGRVAPETGAAGGLIGTVEADTEMSFCSSVIAVTGSEATGGLVGTLSGAGASLNGCYAQAMITGGTVAGGLIGDMQSGKLTNCFFYSDGTKGKIEGTTKGAIAGQAGNGVDISQCYWVNGVDGLSVVGNNINSSWSACSSFSADKNILDTPVTISGKECSTLIEALHAGTAGMNWVWIYGKDYPVVEKK